MYEAKRWREDSRLQAPMATWRNNERVFVGDFVSANGEVGRVRKFFVKV